MKKTFAVSLLCTMAAYAAFGADYWLMMTPTVCKLDTSECYSKMGAGYEREKWDATGQCWGQKLICPEALTSGGSMPVAMTKDAIKKGTGISSDFDTNILNGDCFGKRKTSADGSMASINGTMVPVWCNGIVSSVYDYTTNGEITDQKQPTCRQLADIGYIGLQENGCYGRPYDYTKYYIECDENSDSFTPSRIIILNGAEYITGTTSAPIDKNAANSIFDNMESVSERQREKYFTK